MNPVTIKSDYIDEVDKQNCQPDEAHLLLSLIAKGDQKAFIYFYRRYHTSVFNFINRLIRDYVGSEDVLQEVFMAVWKNAKTFKGKAKVETWMYRIAYYKSMSWLRKRRDAVTLEFIDENYSEDTTDKADILDARRVKQSLAKLSVKQRAVVELTFMQGMTYREVAEILQIPLGTVKSRMSSALTLLSKVLKTERG